MAYKIERIELRAGLAQLVVDQCMVSASKVFIISRRYSDLSKYKLQSDRLIIGWLLVRIQHPALSSING